MMTEFYQEDYRIRSVRIGEQSSLPGLEGLANVQQNTKAVLDEDDEIFLGYGFRSNVFPYRPQDVYTREQTERCYRSIVLENEFLRARFLPELGGRLISLTDKASGRDLLYQNKTLYAGNLAMRNSWFSGGVEWNASIIGHNPFTCSPLFAARTQLADGTPVLRMYEYERLRGVSFQMDFFLPDGSRVLFARMRLVNENAQTVPTYWWSNIAVPEWRGGRVVAPADAAYVARDGVIFKDRVPQSLVDFVKKQGKPCVTINTYLDDPELIQVRAEDRRGGYLAARHLIELGHRNILFIGAVNRGFMNNDQRYAGYCDALEEAGITPNPENLITNLFPFKAERGIALGRQLAAQRAITGVCVSGDQYAAAVITGLREGGARVPEDISIVGFDDVDIARMTFPPLTTIHQDGIGKGRRAAEAIFAMIDGEHPDPKDFNLPVKLIVRGSTGPARTN